MERTTDQKSRDFVLRFFPSLGAGVSSFVVSLVLIVVAHRFLLWLGFVPKVASMSAILGWFASTGMGFLGPEKEPMKQYLETKALAYPVAGIAFGVAMMIAEDWEWQYLPGMILSVLIYLPAIVLREISEVIFCYKL